MATKFVVNTAKILMHPTTIAGAATGDGVAQVDFSAYMSDGSLTLKKADVNVSAFGDPADTHAKGPGNHSAQLKWMHASAMSATLGKLVPEFATVLATPFTLLANGPVAIGVDNPEWGFSVMFVELQLQLKRGAVLETSATYPVQGQVSYWDGTTQTLL